MLNWTMSLVVDDAMLNAIHDAVYLAVSGAVYDAVDDAVYPIVYQSTIGVVGLDAAMGDDPPHPALVDFLARAGEEAP